MIMTYTLYPLRPPDNNPSYDLSVATRIFLPAPGASEMHLMTAVVLGGVGTLGTTLRRFNDE